MAETFRTSLHSTGNNVGIVVPDEVIERLDAGQRPTVKVTLDARYSFVYTVGVMGGKHMIGLSAAHRAASGCAGGDDVTVTLEVETAQREVEIPPELAAALAADPTAAAAFERLSFTYRKEHARAIAEAKAPETKQRRLDKILAALRDE